MLNFGKSLDGPCVNPVVQLEFLGTCKRGYQLALVSIARGSGNPRMLNFGKSVDGQCGNPVEQLHFG